MPVFYVDSSALVKRYVVEAGTGWMRRLANPSTGNRLYTVRLTGPEIVAAIARRSRGGRLPATDANRAATSFRFDWQHQYRLIEADEQLVSLAMELAEKHGLRGYDAVHLAAGVTLQRQRQRQRLSASTFISSDQEQLQAAMAEGLMVEDPNQHA